MIETIEKALMEGTVTPHQAAEYRGLLSGHYSFYAGQKAESERLRAVYLKDKRQYHKSDAATERAWLGTQEGMEETGLHWQLKRIEKMMQGLKALQDLAEGEARNQY